MRARFSGLGAIAQIFDFCEVGDYPKAVSR